MSFTSEVKDELSHVKPVCSHCQRSMLAALVRIHGSLYLVGGGSYRLEVITDALNIARFIKAQLGELYGLQVDIVIRQSVLHKTPNYLMQVPPQPGLRESLHDLGILREDGGLAFEIRPALVEKECCAAAYVRGAFLGSGFIANPQGNFHFEITLSSEPFAQGIVDILKAKGIPAKITHRRNSFVVYLKSGDAIADFLAFSGAHACALSFERTRLIKSISNDVNRATNAEIANSKKTVNASFELQEAIKYLEESGNFSRLSPALREIARLRLQHPDASLKTLGELASPPLSKSAVAHRVHRIEELAQSCKAKG